MKLINPHSQSSEMSTEELYLISLVYYKYEYMLIVYYGFFHSFIGLYCKNMSKSKRNMSESVDDHILSNILKLLSECVDLSQTQTFLLFIG